MDKGGHITISIHGPTDRIIDQCVTKDAIYIKIYASSTFLHNVVASISN